MKFDISKFAETLGTVSESDAPQLIRVPLADIVPDERNFYRIERVAELAASIELVGLQEPLVVRRDGDKYRVVSGHRRRAALEQLVSEGKEQFAVVPCMEETDEISAEEQEVRLILGNATSRRLVPIELSKQSERLDLLFRRMEEQGQRIDGRKRDLKAKLLGVSPTKLAELDVIRDKLVEPFKGQFARNELTQSAAYAIARMPAEVQHDLGLALDGKGKPVEGTGAERLLERHEKLYEQAQKPCAVSGGSCGNLLGFIRACTRPNSIWKSCEGQCCYRCFSRSSCPSACGAAKKLNAEDKAEKQAEKDRKTAKKKKQQKEWAVSNQRIAQRLLRAAEAAELEDDEKVRLENGTHTVGELRDWSAGKFGKIYIGSDDALVPWNRLNIRILAEQLHCSTDYILGLTEELRPAPAPEEGQLHLMAWMPGGTTPGHDCEVVMEFDFGDGKPPHKSLGNYSMATREFRFKAGSLGMEPTRWIELPE